MPNDSHQLPHERFRNPETAAGQLLHAAVKNDGKAEKIQLLDGSFETYVVKRVTWKEES